MCQKRGKPYGILVRKMDFPSSASFQEMRRLMRGGQSGGMPGSACRFWSTRLSRRPRGTGARRALPRPERALAEGHRGRRRRRHGIRISGQRRAVRADGRGRITAESCVVAPSILIDDLELQRMEEELPKLPIVPAPYTDGEVGCPCYAFYGRYIFREIFSSALLGTFLATSSSFCSRRAAVRSCGPAIPATGNRWRTCSCWRSPGAAVDNSVRRADRDSDRTGPAVERRRNHRHARRRASPAAKVIVSGAGVRRHRDGAWPAALPSG